MNEFYDTPEMHKNMEVAAAKIAYIQELKMSLVSKLKELEQFVWDNNLDFIDVDNMKYVDTCFESESFDMEDAHKRWMASNHNC